MKSELDTAARHWHWALALVVLFSWGKYGNAHINRNYERLYRFRAWHLALVQLLVSLSEDVAGAGSFGVPHTVHRDVPPF